MMMNTNKKFSQCPLIFTALFLLVAVFVFSNSFRSGEESQAQSAPLVDLAESIFDPNDVIPTEDFNFIVRKAAHIAEFSLIGLTLGGLMCCIHRLLGRWHIAAMLFIGLATGVLDEFIQSFTGRTSSLSDVLIDFAGVILGMGLAALIGCRQPKNGAKKK